MNDMTWSEEHWLFYQSIGYALSQWAQAEHAVAALMSACVRGSISPGITSGYYAIEGFRSRLAFASQFVEANTKDPQLLQAWAETRKRLNEVARQRNKLAHYTTLQWPEHKPGRRLSLMPWPLKIDERTQKTSLDGALFIVEIERIRRNFSEVNLRLLDLNKRLWGQQSQPSDYVNDPRSLAQMLQNMRQSLYVRPPEPNEIRDIVLSKMNMDPKPRNFVPLKKKIEK